MQQSAIENRVIIACAGSGKTHRIATEALAAGPGKQLVLTYTKSNRTEIADRLQRLNGGIYPDNIVCMGWHDFLIHECANPYRRHVHAPTRMARLSVGRIPEYARKIPKTQPARYYFDYEHNYYIDRLGDFVCASEDQSDSAVTYRLSRIFENIFIDEFQDIVGWDLEWVFRMLATKNLPVMAVGDPKQFVLRTNDSTRHRPLRGPGIIPRLKEMDGQLIVLEEMNESRRCHQDVCAISNQIWDDGTDMSSVQLRDPGHTGLFIVRSADVDAYMSQFSPQILGHSKRSKNFGYGHINFGLSKGQEWDHVLISCTRPIREFLKKGAIQDESRVALHVAVTRARYSVGFVCDDDVLLKHRVWKPDEQSKDKAIAVL